MSDGEEIVSDDEKIEGESDPEYVQEVASDTPESDEFSTNDEELKKSSKAMQLSCEEDVIGSGDSIMKMNDIPDKPDEEREKQILKEIFPNVYKRKYPDG